MLVARLAGDRVVIELDRHDKLLVDALQARGVPETQIVSRLSRGCYPGLNAVSYLGKELALVQNCDFPIGPANQKTRRALSRLA